MSRGSPGPPRAGAARTTLRVRTIAETFMAEYLNRDCRPADMARTRLQGPGQHPVAPLRTSNQWVLERVSPTQNVRVKRANTRLLHNRGQVAKKAGEAKTNEAERAKKS